MQSTLTPEEVRGKEFGVVQAANNLGSVIGPILGGYLYDLFFNVRVNLGENIVFIGAGFTFIFSGILAIIAMVLVIFFIDQKDIENNLRVVPS